ncbi:SDR family NAD(P)-dependent oxidoreductase [Amycolatopsis sp. QT-25]|uniref:SDR family NAD(P)-dependent oxidoreductase n=1 Tax=Amycolatopsis sp. QT-25 TaxID=3034022 RepID=UPI0023ECAF24|nr:SDR family NAD(P)-dependent oxidoreductase [Amycolatopsis sp. QT-25]WET83256.1 SDR family NAD(P)-dependent oxidoreductase [Amycolatopsis sp. QT-25]
MVQRRSGSIIKVSSTAGTVGYRHFGSYFAAKHDVIGLSGAVTLDHAPLRVKPSAPARCQTLRWWTAGCSARSPRPRKQLHGSRL